MQKPLPHDETVGSLVPVFFRDRFTWLTYIMLAYITYLQCILSPLSSIFQSSLHLDYARAGVPVGAFAVGSILVCVFGERIFRPLAYHARAAFWGTVFGLTASCILLLFSQDLVMIAVSTFLMGCFKSLSQSIIQSVLSDHHLEQRVVAFSEANILGGLAAVLAPLCIGGFQASSLGWRVSFVIVILALFASVLLFGRVPIIETLGSKDTVGEGLKSVPGVAAQRRSLVAFWCFWISYLCSIASEWSLLVWGAVLLAQSGLTSEIATMAGSFFFLAETLGRVLGSRLARHIDTHKLLMLFWVGALLCFLVFWLFPFLPLRIVMFFLTGLAVGNLYPFSWSLAMSTMPQQASLASSRCTLSGAIALLCGPIILGSLADFVGIQLAYISVLVVILTAIVVAAYAYSVLKRRSWQFS